MDRKQNKSRFEEQRRQIAESTNRQVIYGLVGATLYGLFSWITNIYPLPAVGGVIFRPAIALLVFFGVAYGPWAGVLAGFIGSSASDFVTGLDYYWNWSLGNAFVGMIAGLFMIKFEDFGKGRDILRAIGAATLAITVGMMFASLMEIFRSGIDLGTALVEYFPFAFLGNFVCAVVLLPIFMIVFAAVISRRAR